MKIIELLIIDLQDADYLGATYNLIDRLNHDALADFFSACCQTDL